VPPQAVSAYLDLIGYRLLDGFDISEPYAFELPDALLRAIRIAIAGKSRESSDVESRIDSSNAARYPSGTRVRTSAAPPASPSSERNRWRMVPGSA
jgi:hypothetical protein